MSALEKLTEMQEKTLRYIHRFLEEHGRPPAYREIRDGIKVKSTSTVSYHMDQLRRKGLLRRDKHVARGLSLTEAALAYMGRASPLVEETSHLVRLQIMGKIQAGETVDPFSDSFSSYDRDDTIGVDAGLLPRRRDNIFALRVQGMSMIDALINDGDIVIFQRATEVRNGDMVAVWLLDKHETTLKRIYYEGEMTRLQPANPDFAPIMVPTSEVVVQGKVVLVQRRL